MSSESLTGDTKHKVPPAAVYQEHRTQLGRMNDTLYRMPLFFATVIGGLWYFAAQYTDNRPLISAGVFAFAAVCALTFALALRRYQLILLAYIRSVDSFEGEHAIAVPPTRVRTATMFVALLLVGFVLSVIGIIYVINQLPKAIPN